MPVFNKEKPIKSTGDMMTWFTSRPCEHTTKSHISQIVVDSTWEMTESFELDHNPDVIAWVKNDHLGFVINYVYRGVIHRYYPDFLIKLKNDTTLILEIKGKDDQQNKTKREYLGEWVNAVNSDGRFGKWVWAVSFRTSDIKDILKKNSEDIKH
jgi:type III restriction enzyme